MIKEVKSFKVYCDRCDECMCDGVTDDGNYSTEQNAENDVEVCGWTKIQIGGAHPLRVIHLCPACATDTLKVLAKALTGKRRKL